MASQLANVLNRQVLRDLAGAKSFERGEDYFASGQVMALAERDKEITARVRGTSDYRVKLWAEGGELGYDCTCPFADEGAFCKHCVAVGLAWLAEKADAGKPRKARKPAVTLKDVEAYLARQETSQLVSLLMEQVMHDEQLRERLLMRVARERPGGVDLTTFRHAIDNAVRTGGFVHYREMWDYTSGIEAVISSIAELLKDGHAAEVIELVEYALTAVEEAMNSVDDSSGHMGGILHDLQELHHAACKKAKPDPEALARRLFEWELRTAWDTFYGAAQTYAGVLGKKGLALYRQLTEDEWARVPALGPGQDDPARYGRRYRITHMMETIALQAGDIEAVVEVKQRDLSNAYAFLQIAEIYKQARQYDKALEWAERGVKAFPQRTDARLREFLADEYHRRKRHDEAMALIWAEFAEAPWLQQYQKLKEHADRARQWPAWREKALAFLRERLARDKSARSQWGWMRPADHSELVRIFLWEGDDEAAWEEAGAGGCSTSLWLELAGRREKQYPAEALPIYQSQIEPTLNQGNNQAYADAVELLKKVRRLMKRLGREAEFAAYLEAVRAAHKRKRNFTKLLDQVKWRD